MDVVSFVAGKAVGRSIAMLVAGFMALGTLRLAVFAKQGKVCEFMIERVFVELHDIGIPAFMVGMTVRAASVARVSVQAVKTGSRVYIDGDVLVAIKAQGTLFGALELGVAGIAVLFIFRMTFYDLTGHNQRFNLGVSLLGNHAQECHCGSSH